MLFKSIPVDESAKIFIERAKEKIGEDQASSAVNLAQRIAAHDGKKSVDTAAIAEAVQYQRGNLEVISKDDLLDTGESVFHKRALSVGAIEDTGFAGLAKSVHDDITASKSKLLQSMIGSGRLVETFGAYDRATLEKLKSVLDIAKEDGVVTDQGLIKAVQRQRSVESQNKELIPRGDYCYRSCAVKPRHSWRGYKARKPQAEAAGVPAVCLNSSASPDILPVWKDCKPSSSS